MKNHFHFFPFFTRTIASVRYEGNDTKVPLLNLKNRFKFFIFVLKRQLGVKMHIENIFCILFLFSLFILSIKRSLSNVLSVEMGEKHNPISSALPKAHIAVSVRRIRWVCSKVSLLNSNCLCFVF